MSQSRLSLITQSRDEQPTGPSKHPIRTHYLGDWLSANQGPLFPDSVGSYTYNGADERD